MHPVRGYGRVVLRKVRYALASLGVFGLLVGFGGSSADRLPSFAAADEPAWSPDGRKIAFVDRSGPVGTSYAMNVDGSNLRQLTR